MNAIDQDEISYTIVLIILEIQVYHLIYYSYFDYTFVVDVIVFLFVLMMMISELCNLPQVLILSHEILYVSMK